MRTVSYTCPVEAAAKTFELVAIVSSEGVNGGVTVKLWKCQSCRVILALPYG